MEYNFHQLDLSFMFTELRDITVGWEMTERYVKIINTEYKIRLVDLIGSGNPKKAKALVSHVSMSSS